MPEILDEKISVVTIYDAFRGTVLPVKLSWHGREYRINKLGYYHHYKVGRTMIHAYHVSDGVLDFSLECDGDNLHWILKEVIDATT